jgi:hypothetical protein
MSTLPTGLQVFPGQPVSNGQALPGFRRLLVDGVRYLVSCTVENRACRQANQQLSEKIYATTSGIVFYTAALEYVSTFPFPSESTYGASNNGDYGEQGEGYLGFDVDQDGSVSMTFQVEFASCAHRHIPLQVLLWRNRNVWIIRSDTATTARDTKVGAEIPLRWKLHSEIRSQHPIRRAQLVKSQSRFSISKREVSL